jgi:hypothetical protein
MGYLPEIVSLVSLLISAFAIYRGITGKDMYSRSSDIPLPKPLGRALYFVVAAVGIYIGISVLR